MINFRFKLLMKWIKSKYLNFLCRFIEIIQINFTWLTASLGTWEKMFTYELIQFNCLHHEGFVIVILQSDLSIQYKMLSNLFTALRFSLPPLPISLIHTSINKYFYVKKHQTGNTHEAHSTKYQNALCWNGLIASSKRSFY